MKPKKLENGRIPVSKPSEKVESDKQKYDKYVAKTQTSQNKQLEQEKQNDSLVKQGTASKSSDENVSSTTKSMPNYSKVDNTIKIENIYASQIVEEIRRERERKVLQKRRFKKSVDNKSVKNIKTKSKMQYNVQLMKCMLNKRNAMLVIVH